MKYNIHKTFFNSIYKFSSSNSILPLGQWFRKWHFYTVLKISLGAKFAHNSETKQKRNFERILSKIRTKWNFIGTLMLLENIILHFSFSTRLKNNCHLSNISFLSMLGILLELSDLQRFLIFYASWTVVIHYLSKLFLTISSKNKLFCHPGNFYHDLYYLQCM